MHFAYKNSDGTVAVVYLAPKARGDGETNAEFLSRIKAQVLPPGATEVVDNAPLPSCAYRGAWRMDGAEIRHDMAQARTMKMAEIRAERNRRLAESDGLWLAAQDRGGDAVAGALKARRQALRDLLEAVDLSGIDDPDELAGFEPEWP